MKLGDINMRVVIEQSLPRLSKKIWFIRSVYGEETMSVLQSDLKTEKQYKWGDKDIEPTFEINDGLYKLLADAIHEYGYTPPEKMFIEGKFEATENHLKDLRQLLKLK